MFTSGCLFEERVLYGEERVTSLAHWGWHTGQTLTSVGLFVG